MSNYFADYCALLNSHEQITHCQQAESLGDLLMRIKQLWSCPQLDDGELLGEINRLNQMPVGDTTVLAGNWLPHRYQPKRKQVHWLIPVGHATEPFQDEYISRCSQQLFNQIIQPRTSLESVLQQAAKIVDVQPAGFVFHLSRCGSTLVSGCLSELDSTCVLSESPLLTELLLDKQLSPEELKISLRAFIDLQASAFPNRSQMIIKWNAWDIFQWELIRELYPQVPAIFLVRNPVEILASHQRSVGRHMSGDPTLVGLHSVFAGEGEAASLLDFRIDVLQSLLLEMNEKSSSANCWVVDYQQLNEECMASIYKWFGCVIDQFGFLKIQERLRFHSKAPSQVFVDDRTKKQLCFTIEEQEKISRKLTALYAQLLAMALKPFGMVINDC